VSDDASIALVVGGVDHGESDRIVHLITPHGRFDVFAPGARRSKRRFAGAFEPFQTIAVEVHRARAARRGLATATSARVLRPRLGLRQDLERIALASFAAELSLRVAPEGEATDAYHRLEELLDHLEAHPADLAARRAFELRLVAALGYAPSIAACASCGRASPPFLVDFDAGGLLCAAHAQGSSADRIGPGTQSWMADVLGAAELRPHGPHEPSDARRAAKTIGPALDRFFAHLLPGPLRSRALLSELGL